MPTNLSTAGAAEQAVPDILVRKALVSDLPGIMAFDERSSKEVNPNYWQEMFDRYCVDGDKQLFLVCEAGADIVGFIIGEVRDWEFGSPPCGWVFALGVRPDVRLAGIATQLYSSLCHFFASAGVDRVRSMVSRNNNDFLSFYRSQGMMAGPFVQLEKDL